MKYRPALLLEQTADGSMMERAYLTLKRDIIELRRPPGQHFTEPDVAASMGLSKTPVREALARLHRDGLVQPMPRAGYVVSSVTLGDVANLCDMRTLLQGEASALTASLGLDVGRSDRLAELSVDDTYGQLGGPYLNERLVENYEFETIIANGAGNARLTRSIVEVLDEIERVVRLAVTLSPSMPEGRIGERMAIVDAIAARDPHAARAAMQHRTQSARREIIDALTSSHAVTSTPILLPS
ncbi:GntR family transcriptional regulator [Rhodococcoides kyotonense]|uniref:DNA-binding transcriptional regulator, GntR family n=1 Tax=Rhodococcoides kyotonense TaxID=398843 RepID=A0A239N3D6_9NOCA|nr:GntR family transcriptional regulator [Rhodococcus kyotonensis]SNT49385.1 DNA-binding transcriptional regulator, GntR family [Rhodococcus kyotonensis]